MVKHYIFVILLLFGLGAPVGEAGAAPAFAVSVLSAAPGASVLVTLMNGPGTANDCVTLDSAGLVDNFAHLGFEWVSGSTAVLSFVLPSIPGAYAFRFWQNCATLLATSSAITVQGASLPLLSVNGGTAPLTVPAGTTVTVGVQNGIATDCLTLDRVSVVDNFAHLGFAWVTGSVVFAMPNAPGAYAIRYWRGCATQLAISPTVTVPGAAQLRTLTVLSGGNGSGTVTGSGQYPVGTAVPITATPAAGSVFSGWSDTSGPFGCRSGTVVMPDDSITCTAIFTVLRTLVILTDGNGTGTVTGAGPYVEGTIVSMTATPSEGSSFAGWKDTSGPWGCVSGQFQMPANSITCTATFTQGSGGGATRIYKPFVASPGYYFGSEFHPWCGLFSSITVPNPLPTATMKAYIAVTGPLGIIKIGILVSGGRVSLLHNDPWYGGGDNHNTSVFFEPGQRVRVYISCCTGSDGQYAANDLANTFFTFWFNKNEGQTINTDKPFQFLPVSQIGRRGGAISQGIEVFGTQGEQPAVGPVWFTDTITDAFLAGSPTGDASANPFFCVRHQATQYLQPGIGVIDQPRNDDPYDQHWTSAYFNGFFHKH